MSNHLSLNNYRSLHSSSTDFPIFICLLNTQMFNSGNICAGQHSVFCSECWVKFVISRQARPAPPTMATTLFTKSSCVSDVIVLQGIGEPSIYHALIVIFLEFFAWGLLTNPMLTVRSHLIAEINLL